MGKKKAKQSSSDAIMAQISRALFEETQPLRTGVIERSADFLADPTQVTNTPQFGAMKSINDMLFGRAREGVLANTPQGGALFDNLNNLELAKARDLSQAAGSLAENEVNRAVSIGTGQPLAQSLGGLRSSAALQQQQNQFNAQQSASTKQGLGQVAGTVAGGMIGGPAGAKAGNSLGGGIGNAAAGIGGK